MTQEAAVEVNSLSDLYRLFSAEDFVSLNRRIYKATECGASISIYGRLPVDEVSPQERQKAEKEAVGKLLADEHRRLVPALTEVYNQASAEEKEEIEKAETAFFAGSSDLFVSWARSVLSGAFPVTSVILSRAPVAYHNGHTRPVPESFELTGFSIHTIVEGSDATVDSKVFPLATTEAEVKAWIDYMEDEAEWLWRQANQGQ